MTKEIEYRLQPKQEEFLSSSADIVIGGGSAGGGKTYALDYEPIRHKDVAGFEAVLLRRSYPEIIKPGGAWDEAKKMYPSLGGVPNVGRLEFRFPKMRVSFGHIQNEKSLDNWKSAQIALLMFDQLETFTERMFFYMLSRNRSACGVSSYCRATANPEPNWLAELLAWWIAEDGYADMDRAGKMRAFIRLNNQMIWADTKAELLEKYPDELPKTITFIPFTIYDNPILMRKDPGYLANLKALDYIDRERLLGDPVRGGNWKIKPSAGKIFNRAWFEIVDAVPAGGRSVRFWDLAATAKKEADFTSSVKMCKVGDIYYILDCTNDQIDPARANSAIKNLAEQDGKSVAVRWEMEGGASGKRDSYHIATMLDGYDAQGIRPQGDKITRAKPLAAQALAGNVKLLRGPWNEMWLNHMHNQPELPHDDIMDASSGAYNDFGTGRVEAVDNPFYN